SSGALTSTRPGCVAPSGRRIVTDTFPATTCTFVRIVSGATKKPVPYPALVSTRTTAGSARLITSSSGVDVAALAVTVAGIRVKGSAGDALTALECDGTASA